MGMRRFLIMISVLFLVASCTILPTTTQIPLPPTLTPQPEVTSTVLPIQIPSPVASLSPTPKAPTNTPAPGGTSASDNKGFTVLYHPDDVLYVGDQLSLEVISPPGLDVKDADLQVQVDSPGGPSLGPVKFGAWGIAGRDQATLLWAWNTKGQDPGPHTLTFTVEPQGITWTEQVNLLPASAMPPDEASAQWASTQTQCCTVFYITNTASERDLPELSNTIDAQAQDVTEKMGTDFTQPITITLLPRLLGNGGFTSTEISVSYLDRNYSSTSWAMVVHHEMVHALDGELGGDFRPTIFVEGLAVYLTGGHYEPEPLMPRAAALLSAYLNEYIPLKTLADNFYASQHEIGYLEAGSLVEYMVNTYGWEAYSSFYRDIHNKEGESQSDSINHALQDHFSISLSQLEQNFLAALNNEPDTAQWADNVRLTVDYYETMRRYQQLLDPSAYFATAWLLDNKTMRERGIVADYLRHPHTPTNLAIETMLITAGKQMQAQDYSDETQTLQVISFVLNGIQQAASAPFSVSPLASSYFSISGILQQQGFEVQSITISDNSASTEVTTSTGPDLIPIDLQLNDGQWSIIP
jgi:hypothetical protein